MPARRFLTVPEALLVIVILAILTALLLPQVQSTWNSGTHERMREKLMVIGQTLMMERNSGLPTKTVDPRDFQFQSAEQPEPLPTAAPAMLAQRHGIKARWHRDGAFERILFYPIAVEAEIAIDPWSNAEPTPQMVMVPLDPIDVETLPRLYGCGGANSERLRERQLVRMKRLFSRHGIGDAATLLSDGSVRYILVDELWKKLQAP